MQPNDMSKTGRVQSEVWSVRYTAEGRDCRLGPYFGEVEAKQQATRLRNKGVTVHGIDHGIVEWVVTAPASSLSPDVTD